jgi:hypothetical protein
LWFVRLGIAALIPFLPYLLHMKTCFLRGTAALVLLSWLPVPGRAQSVGIGTATPDAKAALDIQASDRGLLIPRLSAAQRTAIAAPPQGLLVYQTDGTTSGGLGTGFWYYAGSPAAWVFLNPAGGGADNLGNHTATTTLNLQSNALVGTGASLGTTVGVGVRADGGLNLGQNTTGNNVYLGYQAGQNNSTGILNYFSGYQSGVNNTTGFNNHFEGYQSGLSNTTSNNNQFIGNGSGYANTTGTFNYFNGYRSGYRNTTGSYNYFSGMLSGRNNTLGSNNQFSGYQSGFSNSTGSNNQFSGYQSGFSNSTGNNNVFSGYQSGYVNSTGSENVFVGYQSGGDGINRNGNTALGAYSGTYYNNITNSTALGYNTVLSTSNTVKLGNDDTRLLSCAVGLSVYSDARVKTDVRADVPGLAFVTRLRPVTYLFDAARLAALIQVPARPCRAEGPAADLTRHTGFLAQDVERVA